MPLVIPLTVLIFLASFIPFVGAVATGIIAVLLALVAKGFVHAIVMLGIVLLVQQVESNVLQPFLMGKAVSVHPLAVVLAVTVGSYQFGIVGALFAVPLVASVSAAIGYLAELSSQQMLADARREGVIASGEGPNLPGETSPGVAARTPDSQRRTVIISDFKQSEASG